MTTPTLGLIEAFDRHGALLARAPITHWPVTVGRAMDCDLVLDDRLWRPSTLRITRTADGHRTVQVQVLETRNGVRLQRRHHGQGACFDWQDGAPMDLGRTHIALRLADTPIADELPLPQFPWRTVATTALLVALVLVAALASSWLEARDMAQYLEVAAAGAADHAGGDGRLVGPVGSGQQAVWRPAALLAPCGHSPAPPTWWPMPQLLSHLTAFAFSLEALSRFAPVLTVLVLAERCTPTWRPCCHAGAQAWPGQWWPWWPWACPRGWAHSGSTACG